MKYLSLKKEIFDVFLNGSDGKNEREKKKRKQEVDEKEPGASLVRHLW